MRIALCNEVLSPLVFAQQCELAARLGYQGLEIAPFTLGDQPHRLSESVRIETRRAAADAGLSIVGLHWLLKTPEGLSITSEDVEVRRQTMDVLLRMIELCADLGGGVLVHGSPAQRRLPAGPADDPAVLAARQRAFDAFQFVAQSARQSGVVYCIEPLAQPEANFINTVEEAAQIVRRIGQPSLCTMLDCCAAARAESVPVHEVLERWLPSGLIAHIQLNDPNMRAPGQGELDFKPILRTLQRHGYAGWMSVEPFEYVPDGPGCAASAITYLREVLAS